MFKEVALCFPWDSLVASSHIKGRRAVLGPTLGNCHLTRFKRFCLEIFIFLRQELLRMSDCVGFAGQGLGIRGGLCGELLEASPVSKGAKPRRLHGSQGDPWGAEIPLQPRRSPGQSWGGLKRL